MSLKKIRIIMCQRECRNAHKYNETKYVKCNRKYYNIYNFSETTLYRLNNDLIKKVIKRTLLF